MSRYAIIPYTILTRTLAVVGMVLALASAECWAAEPTLARMSFWVPPERMGEFEAIYREKLAPILKRHGLVASSGREQATVDSVFARLVKVGSAAEAADRNETLQNDPAWKEALRELGAEFGTVGRDSLIRNRFGIYSVTAGPGRAVPAGFGKVAQAGCGTGRWRTYDVANGLAGGNVISIFQDREGHLWFLTYGVGVARYDGQTFRTFTTRDGLADNYVYSIFQDREGRLWVGTIGGGVSRYEGNAFTTLIAGDGSAGSSPLLTRFPVKPIVQDRDGHLWFGTDSGVRRYDGQSWTTFTREDGLAGNGVKCSFQDREGNL